MKQSIKVALLGATGKAGKYLLKQLLQQGYVVKALIRQPENFNFPNSLLEIVKGDAKDLETARSLLDGCAVVISSIGQKPAEPLISSLATVNILKIMAELNIKRYILLAGLNLDVPGDQKSDKNKASSEWMKQTFPIPVADKQLAYDLLTKSNVNWTLVRLPWIEQTDERRGIVVNLEDCLGEVISTTDLADFLIQQIAGTLYIKKCPFVASL